jgi:hypothetical protein
VTDRGSIVLGWLGKLAIGFALLGLLAFDGFTVVVASFGAADDATTAASAAADDFHTSKSVQSAYNAAVAAVSGKGDTVETTSFSIAQNGQVTLTVDRHPKTLWMHRIGALKHFLDIRQTATGAPGS